MRDALGRFQTVALFGAGSDIGTAILRGLLRDGPFAALLLARDPEGVDSAYLEEAGATVERGAFDALAFDTHAAVVESLFATGRDLDLAVLAFGVLGDQATAEADGAEARAVVDTNFTAAVSVLTPLLERMVAQGHGTVVVLSSVAGVRARRSNYVYGAAKAGLDAFCQGAQLRLQGSGVGLVIVRPGFVTTKMTARLRPLPLSVTAEQVADAVIDGIRAGATVIWVPPAMRLVALGLRVAPRRVLGSL